jgi:hypothetical protein
MPQAPPAVPGSNREEQITYYAGILDRLPGTYQGNYAQYDGLTWSVLYQDLAGADTSADPKKLADAVLGIEAAQRLGTNLNAADKGLAGFVTVAEKAAASTNFAAGVPGAGGLAAIGDFFARLTQGATWLRVAEVVLGAGLIIVALAKLASNTPVGRAAAKAGKAALIL